MSLAIWLALGVTVWSIVAAGFGFALGRVLSVGRHLDLL